MIKTSEKGGFLTIYVHVKIKSQRFLPQSITDVKSLQGKLGKLVEDKPVSTLKYTEMMSGSL